MAKLIRKIFNILLVLIIIVLCVYFALRSKNQLLIYNVATGSMEENIHVGDYVLIYKSDDYDVGDVVTFKKDGGFITHRIVKQDGATVTTKGDANNIEDDIIDKDSIVGKVIVSGGILNIIIRYKYSLVGMLLSLYLLSCYFGKEKQKNTDINEKIEDAEDSNK